MMGKILRCICLAAALSLWTGAARAQVVTFDDLTGTGNLGSYAGITWTNTTYYDDPQPPYNPHSLSERVYNTDHISGLTMDFGGPIIFDGAYFAGYPEVSGPNQVKFDLFDGATLVGTSGTLLPSSSPSFLSSGYSGPVTKVHVSSTSGNYWVMDDVTYHAASSTVPEPSALAGLGGMVISIAGFALRRRRA